MESIKVVIEFELDSTSGDEQLYNILTQAARKIRSQLRRPPSLCTAPEADDVLLDYQGTHIGTVSATKTKADGYMPGQRLYKPEELKKAKELISDAARAREYFTDDELEAHAALKKTTT